ncbi:MAG: DedA family protein [Solirubrobacterales bacterium]|nr:DedA family protein [Solirubrobacterales bacterium]
MLASVTEHLTNSVGSHGAIAVFLLMAVDAILPVGGEIVMLYAGVLAAGALSQHAALFGIDLGTGLGAYIALAAAGGLGYLVGALVGWLIGVRGGRPLLERHGRWLHLGPERMDRAERWFHRFGAWAVFLGRLTPLVRSFISIPAGVLGSPLGSYTVLTLAGSMIWCLVFAGAGWAAGSHWESVHSALHYVDYVVVAAVLGLAVLVLVRRRRSGVRSAG